MLASIESYTIDSGGQGNNINYETYARETYWSKVYGHFCKSYRPLGIGQVLGPIWTFDTSFDSKLKMEQHPL